MQTLASEGVRGLFRGMAAPLATVALFNAVLFATRGQMERLLAHPDGGVFTWRLYPSMVKCTATSSHILSCTGFTSTGVVQGRS